MGEWWERGELWEGLGNKVWYMVKREIPYSCVVKCITLISTYLLLSTGFCAVTTVL